MFGPDRTRIGNGSTEARLIVLVFVNGKFVPEEEAVISAFDRGFLYGDGLFETMRVLNGTPFRFQQHMERLQRGAHFLDITLPCTNDKLRGIANELLKVNATADAVLRVVLSRGVGKRGYSPLDACNPSLVLSLHPAPARPSSGSPGWRLVTSSIRIEPGDALAQHKTCNKLPQILARAEADRAGAEEALLLNTRGSVVEGSASNLFWISNGAICTPPAPAGILPGITRSVIQEIGASSGIPCHESTISRDELLQAEGVFLTQSSVGIAQGISLDGVVLSRCALMDELAAQYQRVLENETGK